MWVLVPPSSVAIQEKATIATAPVTVAPQSMASDLGAGSLGRAMAVELTSTLWERE